MAKADFTAIDSLSHEEKEERFPMTGGPFGIWFAPNRGPDNKTIISGVWVVNNALGDSADEHGKAFGEFETYGDAVMFSMSLIEEAEQDIQKAKAQFIHPDSR